jgi:predicted MFS family arabinose efflux permease
MVTSIFDFMGALGASILLTVLGIGLFGAIYVSGHWVAERQNSRVLGTAAGVLVFLLSMLLFAPSLEALTETSCITADDRQACIEGDDE